MWYGVPRIAPGYTLVVSVFVLPGLWMAVIVKERGGKP